MTRTPRPYRPAPRPAGFTLIEMMVAISITSVMLLLVSRIFNSTTKAISIGADTSQIVANSRTVSDQLFQDAARMNVAKANGIKLSGAGKLDEPGGFLVIIQQRNRGVRFPNANNPLAPPEDWLAFDDRNRDGVRDPDEPFFDIRTDQVAFFTRADRAESITPADQTRYDSEAVASFQRIWYGHAARANLDGTTPALINTEPGQTPPPADDFDMSRVTDLVLGRQGLLIIDDTGLWPDGNRVYESSSYAGAPSNTLIYGTTAFGASDINSGLFGLNVPVYAMGVPALSGDAQYNRLHKGPTDVVSIRDGGNNGSTFADQFELAGTGGLMLDGYLTTNTPDPTGLHQTTTPRALTFPRALDDNELPTNAYIQHALGWTFADAGFRLVTNQDIQYPFETPSLGQNHSFFAPYVSDFAVDFAADITDDYAYANFVATGDSLATDPVDEKLLLPWWDERWTNPTGGTWHAFDPSTGAYRATAGFEPDGLPDGRPDEYCIDPGNARITGIKWYNMADPQNRVNCDPNQPQLGSPQDRTRPATWWLPPRANASGSHGPFANELQFAGVHHTPSVLGGTTISFPRFSYRHPAFVGFYANGSAPQGQVTGFNPTIFPEVQSRAVFVFGHTPDYDINNPSGNGDGTDDDGFEAGSAKWWPYALRFRYRLHDGDASYYSVGELPTEMPTFSDPDQDVYGQINGKWFEQIVPVRHHDNHLPE